VQRGGRASDSVCLVSGAGFNLCEGKGEGGGAEGGVPQEGVVSSSLRCGALSCGERPHWGPVRCMSPEGDRRSARGMPGAAHTTAFILLEEQERKICCTASLGCTAGCILSATGHPIALYSKGRLTSLLGWAHFKGASVMLGQEFFFPPG